MIDAGIIIGCIVIGFGFGFAVQMAWHWWQARKLWRQWDADRKLRLEIADTLVKRLRALNKMRVVK